MGDSLIGRTAGFDPVSPGSSPGPPANKSGDNSLSISIISTIKIITAIYMFLFNLSAQSNFQQVLINTLSKWNINFDELEKNKAVSACINRISNKQEEFKAIGFSFQSYDIKYAKKVAQEGCEQMKKKKILDDCTCEIIIVNEKIIRGN